MRFDFLNPELTFAIRKPRKAEISIGMTGRTKDRMIHAGYTITAGLAKYPYPIIIASEMLRYQGRLLTYIYKNLQAATVFVSKGSDISISYSLKLNKYPFVLNNVNTNARTLMISAHISGVFPIMPSVPYPIHIAMLYPISIR